MNNEMNIGDDEIRVVGTSTPVESSSSAPGKGPCRRRPPRWVAILAAILLLVALAVILFALLRRGGEPEVDPNEGVFDPGSVVVPTFTSAPPSVPALSKEAFAPGMAPFTEKIDTLINDIPLVVLIPHGGVPSLQVGPMDFTDPSIILAAQAADIRRDNLHIVGAFVLAGEPLAWGLSKKGYCGIIDGKISVGVADNSPLFEEATEKGGYFFRQFPLVKDGELVENEIKNKAIRKALCDRSGEIFIAITLTAESMHDFSQALVDLGVDNAIYLVGSSSYGFYRDKDGQLTQSREWAASPYKYENYILWSVPQD